MPQAEYKACRKCGEEKPLDAFHRHSASKDGRQTWCKECTRERNAEWREQNRERAHATTARWASENLARRRETNRAWRERNRERVRETGKGISERYRERHPAKAEARMAVRRAIENGELVRPGQCQRCGSEGTPVAPNRPSIEAHHPDHSKPLEVEWLCHPCHVAADRSAA